VVTDSNFDVLSNRYQLQTFVHSSMNLKLSGQNNSDHVNYLKGNNFSKINSSDYCSVTQNKA
jgi:hypothetical protein